jgi:hypothetical protein
MDLVRDLTEDFVATKLKLYWRCKLQKRSWQNNFFLQCKCSKKMDIQQIVFGLSFKTDCGALEGTEPSTTPYTPVHWTITIKTTRTGSLMVHLVARSFDFSNSEILQMVWYQKLVLFGDLSFWELDIFITSEAQSVSKITHVSIWPLKNTWVYWDQSMIQTLVACNRLGHLSTPGQFEVTFQANEVTWPL